MIGMHLKVRGGRETDRAVAQAVDDVVGARKAGMARAAIMTRDALFTAMSGVGIRVPFWGVKSPPGPVLAARSGHTRNALTPGRVWTVGTTTFASVGHDEPHVKALEFGDTIKPKTGQYLRIPTENAQTASGVDRYTGMSIRAIPNTRLVRTKAGKLWAVRTVGKGAGRHSEYLYLLVRSVKMPKKALFANTAHDIDAKLVSIFETELTVFVKRGN